MFSKVLFENKTVPTVPRVGRRRGKAERLFARSEMTARAVNATIGQGGALGQEEPEEKIKLHLLKGQSLILSSSVTLQELPDKTHTPYMVSISIFTSCLAYLFNSNSVFHPLLL